MTQRERILKRLQEGTWLSAVEATKEMYILRLGARIWDLRHEGYNILERKVDGKAYSEYLLVPRQPVPVMPPAFEPKEKVEANQSLF